MLSQERLKALMSYSPKTGLFTRKVDVSNHRAGEVAGNTCKTHGYRIIGIDGKYYRAHRLAWLYLYGSFPKFEIDHKNGIRHDNRKCNIRNATHSQNRRNVGKFRNNTSGHTGISWFKESKKWIAYCNVNGKRKHLGLFINLVDAVSARNSFAEKAHEGYWKCP